MPNDSAAFISFLIKLLNSNKVINVKYVISLIINTIYY